MRPAALVLVIALVTALLFGFVGRAAESDAMFLIAGMGFLTAIGAAIAMIPFVRNLPWPPRMEELFPRIRREDRFDSFTGDRREP